MSDEALEGMDRVEDHADGDIEAHSFDRPAEDPLSSDAIEEPPDVEAHGVHPAAGSI